MNRIQEAIYTLEDINDEVVALCEPLVELYYNKTWDATSEEEIYKILVMIRQVLHRFHPNVDLSQNAYTSAQYSYIITQIKDVIQKLVDHHSIKKYSSQKLKVQPKLFKGISDLDFVFLNANDHYIMIDEKENEYHIKTTLQNPNYLRNSILNEIFIYKIFELLGYGPTVNACFIAETRKLYTITDDLNNKKENEESVCFVTAEDESLAVRKKDRKWQKNLFILNLLIDFFELTDVTGNKSNYGVRSSKRKLKKIESSTLEIKQKPMIIDFHLRKCSLNLNYKKILDKYFTSFLKPSSYLFDLTPSELNSDKREMIFKMLDSGIHGKNLSLFESINAAFGFTKKIHDEIRSSVKLEKLVNNHEEIYKLKNYYLIEPVISLRDYYLQKWEDIKPGLKSSYDKAETIEAYQPEIFRIKAESLI